MSGFVKLNCTKAFMKPDGTGFFYPTELYSNNGDFIYLFNSKYYLEDLSGWKVVITTNAEALKAQYSEHTSLIDTWEDEEINSVSFKGMRNGYPVLKFNIASIACYLFYDLGKWCLRSSDAVSDDLIWFKLHYEVEVNKRDGLYLTPVFSTYTLDVDTDDSRFEAMPPPNPWLADVYSDMPNPAIISSNSTISGDFNASYDIDSNKPTDFNISTIFSYLKSAYIAYLAYKYEETPSSAESSAWAKDKVDELCYPFLPSILDINLEFKHYGLYQSSTLLGVYAGEDAEGGVITRSVGYLKFKDTLENEYIKGISIVEKSNEWFAGGVKLSNEPAVGTTASYTAQDSEGNNIIVTVSFDSYVSDMRACALFTSHATKGES